MPQILPIRGLRYTAKAGDPSGLVGPPYDVMSPSQRDAIAARSPYNAVNLEAAAGGDERYDAVARRIEAWEQDGILARDPEPMYYVYQQVFREGGQEFTRTALVAAVEAQPWEETAVLPHEYTMSGPKEDRLRLLQAARTQISPLFMIARDRAGQLRGFLDEVTRSYAPVAETAEVDGAVHRFWAVEASRYEARQLAPLLSESFYMADGHHRYETAVAYKQWRLAQEGTLPRDHPARFALAAVVTADDPGLLIRPIHRLLRRAAPDGWRDAVERVFEVTPFEGGGDTGACDAALRAEPGLLLATGFEPGTVLALRLRNEEAYAGLSPAGHSARWTHLPVHLCRYGLLEPLWGIGDEELRASAVEFHHDTAEVLAEVAQGAGGVVAVLLPPVQLSEVLALTDQDERMPQKTTFFHPKMGTGLVFHPMEE